MRWCGRWRSSAGCGELAAGLPADVELPEYFDSHAPGRSPAAGPKPHLTKRHSYAAHRLGSGNSGGVAGAGFCGLFFAVLRWRGSLEISNQLG